MTAAPVRAVASVSAVATALACAALAPIARGAQAADPPTLREGEHEGADYVLSVPARWNGGLVMFAHGYEGAGPGRGAVRGTPLASHLTASGYAWAASGFRSRGYRPDWFVDDTLALRERVIRELGRPRRTIVHGSAMGGHVAIASLELHPDVYQGGFIEFMALHATADFSVPFRLQQNYRRRAQAAGAGHLLVQRVVRSAGQCSFDGAVREQAFDNLVAWIERGALPAGDDVLGDVTKLGLRRP